MEVTPWHQVCDCRCKYSVSVDTLLLLAHAFCQGGDLINDHFMPPIRKLLIGFTGSRLAIGVGISYPDTAAYLKCFDYVIVRSQVDYNMAKEYVAAGFLECMPDLTYFLDRKNQLKPKMTPLFVIDPNEVHPLLPIRIALCIAEPCLATAHDHGDKILIDLVTVVVQVNTQLHAKGFKATFTFIPFNTNEDNAEECDWVAIRRLQDLLSKSVDEQANPLVCTQVLDVEIAQDTLKVFEYFANEVDFVLGMRYHSILFSMISRTPFVALYSTPKIRNLLKYVGMCGTHSDHAMEYFDPESHIPLRFDVDKLVEDVMTVMAESPRKTRFFASNQVAYAAKIRKLIKTPAQFAPIKPDIGYEIKHLDEHHLNRLTNGTMREYLFLNGIEPGADSGIDIDAVLDGQAPLQPVLAPNITAEQVAMSLCRLLLLRFHCELFTPDTMNQFVSQSDKAILESAYMSYIDGFKEKVFDADVPLRQQLNWIINHYYRALHPVADIHDSSNQQDSTTSMPDNLAQGQEEQDEKPAESVQLTV